MKGRSLLALAVLSLALACEGNQLLTGTKTPLDASKVVSDGTRVGGNPDFFFLPPLVPNPVNNSNFERGKFNNRLQPSLSVEICQLVAEPLNALPTGNTACVSGPAVKTFAAGTVRQVGLPNNEAGWWTTHDLPNEGFYYVLWDTRQSNLSTSAYYRIKVLLAGSIVLGFADVDPMDNMREFHNARTGDVIPFVDDASLPIPFRVEKGALCQGGTCNSAVITNTSTTGTQSVTVDAGGGNIAGASFPDGWLPSPEQCSKGSPSCPQSVIVTVSEVNTPGSGLPGETTVCHPALNPKLQQFRACFNYTTTPTLQPFNDAGDQFAADVTVAVCYELEGTTDPRRDFAELYASGPNEPPHALKDVSEGSLVSPATRNCSGGTPLITLRSSNPLMQLASTGWRKFKGGFGRVFGVKTAYAIDQGLGGIVKGFSNVSPVLTANIEASSSTELTLTPGAITTSTVRIVGSHQHADHAPSGIGGLTVTFSASGGTLNAATVTTAADGTASVNWTMPAGSAPGPYTLTADGPALGGPVTFTATVQAPLNMLSMQTGATIQLAATPPDVIATWVSSAPTKFQVSATGLVTAIIGGENSNGGDGGRVATVLSTGLPGPSWLVDTVFNIFPRVTTLAWAPVPGAATYTIATEFGNGCSGFANCTLWTDNGVGTTATTASSFTFGFVGAQPGRWHVTARDANGAIIPGQADAAGLPIADSPSPWIYFRYSI